VLTLHRQHERRPIDVLGRKAAAAVAGGIDPEVGERADDAFRSGSIGLQQADGADLDVKAAILEAPAQEGLRHRRPAQVPGAHDEHRLPLRDGDRRASTRSAAGHRRIVALVDRAMNGGGGELTLSRQRRAEVLGVERRSADGPGPLVDGAAPTDGSPPWPYTWPVRDADALAADLRARGLRVTPQRHLIYSLSAEKPNHLTVEAVHEAVLATLPTVSLRTVYQALHDLEAMGEIRLAQVGNGPLRVDSKPERHSHLHCTKCGRVHDVDVALNGLVLPVEQRRGFAVEDAEVIFTGRCPMCAGDPQGE